MRPSAGLSRGARLLLAAACGLAVATIYVAQPLLDAIADSFGLSHAAAGAIITITQAGYAAGLLLVVPLGDRLDPRRLIVGQLSGCGLAVAAVAAAPTVAVLLTGLVAVGLLAVVIQTIVAYAASQVADDERGAVVGTVTSGVVVGILLSRFVAGVIAELAGWRAVYVVFAGALLVTAAAVSCVIPRAVTPRMTGSYGGLLASTLRLYRTQPLLRRRGILALLTFAAFSAVWTSLVLPLSAMGLSHGQSGAFGLVAAAGALAAARAGRLADGGRARATTGVALVMLTVAWLPIALLHASLWALVVGLLLLDVAVQAIHVTNQTQLYALLPGARSRLAAAYMVCYSIGSAVGASAATNAYAAAGWVAVCLVGGAVSLAALVSWAVSERRALRTVRHAARDGGRRATRRRRGDGHGVSTPSERQREARAGPRD